MNAAPAKTIDCGTSPNIKYAEMAVQNGLSRLMSDIVTDLIYLRHHIFMDCPIRVQPKLTPRSGRMASLGIAKDAPLAAA